jgi:hypothetical protein
MQFIDENTTSCAESMNTKAVSNYNEVLYEEVCKESKKEMTEVELE